MSRPSDPTQPLAELWALFADDVFRGYSAPYERIARAVASDGELLELVGEAPSAAHLPLVLLGAVHYLLLDGLAHPLADVYAGRSDADPAPLFRELCLTRRHEVAALLTTRHNQTNDCGRSAVIGPGLTWVASILKGQLALIDVGASAGLNLRCDQYRLDYGERGATGPADSPVQIRCHVVGGDPPIAAQLPPLVTRIGIDIDPVDLTDPDDARWLLACVWPGTGRFDRTVAAISAAQADPPAVIRGDAIELLPGVLAGLPEGVTAVVLTTWAFAYLSIEQRRQFVALLAAESDCRPIVWLSAESAGIVEEFAEGAGAAEPNRAAPDVVGVVIFERGLLRPQLLAYAQQHGHALDWRARFSFSTRLA